MPHGLDHLIETLRQRFGKSFYAYTGPRTDQVHIFFREQGLAVHVWTFTRRDEYGQLATDPAFFARFARAVKQGEERLRQKS